MDFINTLLNIVVPPACLTALLFFLPWYLFFRFIRSIVRRIFSEDVSGKVVLIVGSSSGIGEHLAYEYARRGACLALVARRENRLRNVGARAELMGSPDAFVIPGDVSKVEDCHRFVDETVKRFGRLDHLVTVAGVTPVTLLEYVPDLTKLTPTMDINFWGPVYSAYHAVAHLKETRGKIIVVASSASWITVPTMSVYSASKAALVTMFETLRVELGNEVGITIVNPGLVQSEMTGGKFLSTRGRLEVDREMRDVLINVVPPAPTMECAKAIVDGACKGEKYLTVPYWYNATLYWKVFAPDIVEWTSRLFLVPGRGRPHTDTLSRRTLDLLTHVKEFLSFGTESTEFPEVYNYGADTGS